MNGKSLSCRRLMASDIPGAAWQDSYGSLMLREDGVIVPADGDAILGAIQNDGRVFWTLSYYEYHGLLGNN